MHRYAIFAGAAAFLIAPSLVLGAGFAKQSIFLSRSSVTEGETVLIHATVNNDATAAFAGTMVFSEGSTKIGAVPVSLDPGEAGAVSVSWKPSAGSHTITADLKKGSDTVETESETFSIAAKPAPPSAQSQTAASVESSENIQKEIASFSPGTASAVAPAFTLIDSGRSQLSDIIDGQVATAKKNLGSKEGTVLGANTVSEAKTDPMGTLWFVLWTLYLYFLTVANFIIGNAGIFYPLLALLVLYFFWRLFTRSRRSDY